VHGHDTPGIRSAERDAPFLAAPVQEDRHEERFAGEQALPRAHERAHESGLLLRAVAEDGLHLDAVVHVHHAAGLGDGGLVRVELDLTYAGLAEDLYSISCMSAIGYDSSVTQSGSDHVPHERDTSVRALLFEPRESEYSVPFSGATRICWRDSPLPSLRLGRHRVR
jgi:hypothetical protein